MPANRQIALTYLECKALWLIADMGYAMPNPDLEKDPELEAAAERALDKVYRADRGIGRRVLPKQRQAGRTGPGLDLRGRISDEPTT